MTNHLLQLVYTIYGSSFLQNVKLRSHFCYELRKPIFWAKAFRSEWLGHQGACLLGKMLLLAVPAAGVFKGMNGRLQLGAWWSPAFSSLGPCLPVLHSWPKFQWGSDLGDTPSFCQACAWWPWTCLQTVGADHMSFGSRFCSSTCNCKSVTRTESRNGGCVCIYLLISCDFQDGIYYSCF